MMKKYIFILSAFFLLFPSGTYAAKEKAIDTILKWADQEIGTLQDGFNQLGQIADTCERKDATCFLYRSWRPEFSARLQLGMGDFSQTYDTLTQQKNACLIEDVNKIENRVGRILKIIAHLDTRSLPLEGASTKEGLLADAEALNNHLFFFRKALQKYGTGDEKTWKANQKRFESEMIQEFGGEKGEKKDIPSELRNLTIYSRSYQNSSACLSPYNLGFYQLKEEVQHLWATIEEIKEFQKSMSNLSEKFNSGRALIKEYSSGKQPRNLLQGWIDVNIEYPKEDTYDQTTPSLGTFYTFKDLAELMRQDKQNAQRKELTLSPKKNLKDAQEEGVPMTKDEVLRMVTTYEEEYESAVSFVVEKNMRETLASSVDGEISTIFDQDVIPLLQLFEKVNQDLEVKNAAMDDVCGAMSSCQ